MDCDQLSKTILFYSAALVFGQAASGQSVTGFIGDEVLLSCIYSDQLHHSINVSWRDRNDKVVLDIINSKENKTDPKFKGRVFSYPDQYKNGNFSILMRDLRPDDAGLYTCYIHQMYYENRENLTIKENLAVKLMSPRPAPCGAAVTTSLHPALLLFVLLCVLCCAGGFFLLRSFFLPIVTKCCS